MDFSEERNDGFFWLDESNFESNNTSDILLKQYMQLKQWKKWQLLAIFGVSTQTDLSLN